MNCLNWERGLFFLSLSRTTNTHKGDGRTRCRQSSGTKICAMSRKSGPTTEDSNAKCSLTYLNYYPAHERAVNFYYTKLTIRDHITDYFPIITNLDSFRFSVLPCRSTKCHQYPWTHLKGTQHLWKKTKPDKMLPNWPVFRQLSWQVTAVMHQESMNYSELGAHRFERQAEKRRYELQKRCAENQEETSSKRGAGGCRTLNQQWYHSGRASLSHKLLKFNQKFCSVKTKMPLDKKFIRREQSSPKGMSMAVTTAPRVFCTASPTFLAISVPPSSSEGSSATSAWNKSKGLNT